MNTCNSLIEHDFFSSTGMTSFFLLKQDAYTIKEGSVEVKGVMRGVKQREQESKVFF